MWVHLQRLIIKKIYILILGNGPTQGLEHTVPAEKCIQLILLKIIKNSV